MSGGEVILVMVAIMLPLAIAIAVTLWTLQPAVIRAERAKRAKRRAGRLHAQEDSAAAPAEE